MTQQQNTTEQTALMEKMMHARLTYCIEQRGMNHKVVLREVETHEFGTGVLKSQSKQRKNYIYVIYYSVL